MSANVKYSQGVTIGIPVYNEEEYVEISILSALDQCEYLIICDNCSTDNTSVICKKIAAINKKITYIRHDENIGAASNFKFVMNYAQTQYFMWLGAHDLIPSDYISRLRQKLDSDPTAALAFGAVRHIDRVGSEISTYDYFFADKLASTSSSERIYAIIRYLNGCSLIHGLFKVEALRKSWLDMKFLGSDHALLASVVVDWKLLYEPNTFLYRRSVHLLDSLLLQLQRVTGATNSTKAKPNKIEMQRVQYQLAISASRDLGLIKFVYRVKCRFWLACRFGAFSQNKLMKCLELLISKAYTLYAKLIKFSNTLKQRVWISNS